LMRFVVLPFGGALMTLKFLEYMIEEGATLSKFVSHPGTAAAPPPPVPLTETQPPDDWDDWPFEDLPAPAGEAPAAPSQAVVEVPAGPDPALQAHGHHHVHLATPWSVALLGAFLLAVLYLPAVRRRLFAAAVFLGRGLRFAFVELPGLVLGLPA